MDHLESIPLWTLVANIKQEISYGQGKLQTRYGTKQFSPGTKVYIIDWYAGMCQDITVIGLSRDSALFASYDMPAGSFKIILSTPRTSFPSQSLCCGSIDIWAFNVKVRMISTLLSFSY